MSNIKYITSNIFVFESEQLFRRDIRLNANFYEAFLKGNVLTSADTIQLGEIANISHPGITRRIYIQNKENGLPFLSTSDMMCYEAVDNKYVSIEFSKNLDDYIVNDRTILISRSGTIGNVALVDKMMNGCAVTEHAIRIVLKDMSYLGLVYTYLISSIGQGLIRGQKSGAVIDEIYDEDVEHIQIPIINEDLITALNNKIIKAKENREIAYDIIIKARTLVLTYNHLPPLEETELETLDPDKETDLRLVSSEEFTDDFRLDAHFYNPMADLVVRNIRENAKAGKDLSDLTSRIFYLNRFKRTFVSDEFGIPYLAGKDIIKIRPNDVSYLSKSETDNLEDYKLEKEWILLTCSGTIGRTCYIWKNYENWVGTHDLIRVVSNKTFDSGYLYAFLSSEYGYHQITRYKHGAVIDHITPEQIEDILIPVPEENQIKEIGDLVRQAYDLRAEAIRLEDEAQEILTNALTGK